MPDPASTAQRQQARQQGFIVGLITLPFRIFGVLCGSLLLSILVECIGMHFFWPELGWRHAQGMLTCELAQVSSSFRQSLIVREPGRTAHRLVSYTYDKVFIQAGLLEWANEARDRATARQSHGITRYLGLAYFQIESYALAAAYTMLTFLARLLVLSLTLPLVLTAALVGLVDGLVRRDIRRFGAGRESGFLYHRAKVTLLPIAVLPWVIYLALPISVHPPWILLPSAILLGIATDLTAGSFKKYL